MSTRSQKLHEAFSFNNQWPAVLAWGHKYNWVDFTFLMLTCEYDKFGAQFEIELGLLGFQIRVCIPMAETEESADLARRAKAVENGTANLVPLHEIAARLNAEHGIKDIFVAQLPDEGEKK